MRRGTELGSCLWGFLLIVALDFPDTTQIFLEENYRSTGAILEASLAIVSQGMLVPFFSASSHD